MFGFVPRLVGCIGALMWLRNVYQGIKSRELERGRMGVKVEKRGLRFKVLEAALKGSKPHHHFFSLQLDFLITDICLAIFYS